MKNLTVSDIYDGGIFNLWLTPIVYNPNKVITYYPSVNGVKLPTSKELVESFYIDCKRCGATKKKNCKCVYCGM